MTSNRIGVGEGRIKTHEEYRHTAACGIATAVSKKKRKMHFLSFYKLKNIMNCMNLWIII